MRLAVFTSVLGPHTDGLKDPKVVNPNVLHVCFTDQPLKSKHWRIEHMDATDDPKLKSRRLKILGHPLVNDADATLWMDAAYQLKCDPVPVAKQWLKRAELVGLIHRDRTTIAQEAEQIAKLGLAPAEVVRDQVASYLADGFGPQQERITMTGFMFRRHCPHVSEFNALWWDQVRTRCWRDQMSVDYCIWKTGLSVDYLPYHYQSMPLARWFYLPRHPSQTSCQPIPG
jgi:hypothetical protein